MGQKVNIGIVIRLIINRLHASQSAVALQAILF